MWWKFWTWFRHDDTPQHVTKAPRKVRSFSGGVPGTESEGPEDILGSLSELIEEQSPEPTDFLQPTRSTESVEVVEQIAAVDPPPAAEVPADTIQKTSKPSDLLQHFNQLQSPKSEPSRGAKPVRPSSGSKRDESQNEARQTLVADDILRALSERFKNFDQSKDDDEGGPSPYQTIVPNDD